MTPYAATARPATTRSDVLELFGRLNPRFAAPGRRAKAVLFSHEGYGEEADLSQSRQCRVCSAARGYKVRRRKSRPKRETRDAEGAKHRGDEHDRSAAEHRAR